MDRFWDGKNNEILDSATLRVSLVVTGFCVWLAAGVSILKFGL